MAFALLSVSRFAMRRLIMVGIVRLIDAQLEPRGIDVRRLARRVVLIAAGVAAAWVACLVLVLALAIHFL
jgi:hypothetical protein